jgi:hypothetical protein
MGSSFFERTRPARGWARVHFFRFWTWLLVVGILIWAVIENRPDIVIAWLDTNLWVMKQFSVLWPSVGPWMEVGLRTSGFDRLVFATFDIVLIRILFSAIAALWRMSRPKHGGPIQ